MVNNRLTNRSVFFNIIIQGCFSSKLFLLLVLKLSGLIFSFRVFDMVRPRLPVVADLLLKEDLVYELSVSGVAVSIRRIWRPWNGRWSRWVSSSLLLLRE